MAAANEIFLVDEMSSERVGVGEGGNDGRVAVEGIVREGRRRGKGGKNENEFRKVVVVVEQKELGSFEYWASQRWLAT